MSLAHYISTLELLLFYYDLSYLLEKTQCIPTIHGGKTMSSAQPLLTWKLLLFLD